MRHPAINVSILGSVAICLSFCTAAAGEDQPTRLAKEIIDSTGVRGGIVVHLGCGDGKLTAALRANDSYTVHGLETHSARVAEARKYIQSMGVYGPVSVEQFSGSVLPYTENLINLVVASGDCQVANEEIMRVLAPGGVALDLDSRLSTLDSFRKPWPDNIDQWTHFLHDATGNAVADDTVVGQPRNLQWIAPPLWLRSHETPSGVQAPVSASGRLFYFLDEGLIGITDERLPDRWSLVCRDAFNGKLLWKRPLDTWGWRDWAYERYAGKDWLRLRSARTNVPAENQRRIVADGDRVYVTLGYRSPMSILDAATGELVTTVEATQNTSEILVSNGIAVTYVQRTPDNTSERRGTEASVGAALVAVDGRTGDVLWEHSSGQIRSLALVIDNGRVVFVAGKELIALDLKDGRELWRARPKRAAPKTLVAIDDVVVLHSGTHVAALDATDGKPLWEQTGPPIGMGEVDDLFVVDGLVWRGMVCVDDNGKAVRKSANSLVVGWDLRTGEEKKRILVNNLRSPEHHHRCYRNKATTRYLISSFEGAEFLDFQGDDHGMNNWLRGACRNGMIPANGMLYVPPDQCFCQPGAKLLGYAAVKAESDAPLQTPTDDQRLQRGPAYDQIANRKSAIKNARDWPTFRHDAARSGSTTRGVPSDVALKWRVTLGGALTAPVAVGDKLFVARSDAHTVYALDAASGDVLWQFTAGGRVDSPPTIYNGMVLFGSADGYAYCLRASDGELAWRFLAAPTDRRVAYYDQVESAWPVHGSILVVDDVAYFTAGRSTYLDGGIRVYGLEPSSGKILHKGLLEGPHRSIDGQRDLAFFILGANSDVLVSEGGFLYMRQKKMTPELQEVDVDVLSSKGAQDVGLHIFSTAGLLDDSWYNRTFWMYSKRWPGFQLANQASKAGQLLVVDDQKTYAVRAFYRRNVHSPMFFPGKEGYLVFADKNTNEPQIVGEEGSREPVKWLPQSDYSRARGNEVRKLNSEAFGLDKMMGYTRAEPPVWMQWLPVRVRAMVKAGDTLFVAGPPDVYDAKDPYAAFEARKGAHVVALAAEGGKKLSETPLDHPPVFDGMIAAGGCLFASLSDGSVVCLAEKRN